MAKDGEVTVDLIDRAGTRYEFATVWPVDVWPHVSAIIMAAAYKEAAKMHGAVQAYFTDDPENPLPEDAVV
jgi:hypothetical protein